MAYKSASEYWNARRARENARKTSRNAWLSARGSAGKTDGIAALNDLLNSNRCSECGRPLSRTGYCINDITLCSRAYTD